MSLHRRNFVLSVSTVSAIPIWASSAENPGCKTLGFNQYIVAAVHKVLKERSGGGYGGPKTHDTSYAFTQDLAYPEPGRILQFPPNAQRDPHFKHATMCVAGVTEITIEAINLFAKDSSRCSNNINPYKVLPADKWSNGRIDSLRPYLFMQADLRNIWRYGPRTVPTIKIEHKDGTSKTYNAVSRGSAHAFSVFGMGEELPFEKLSRGDLINLNRVAGPGHATIFWSYIQLDRNRKPHHTSQWSEDVIGFEFFAAQGPKWPKAGGGFAFRDAYFEGSPRGSAGNTVDPGRIIRQSSQLMLNSGRLWSPDSWQVASSIDKISKLVSSRAPANGATRAATIMQEELGPTVYMTTGEE